MGYNYRTVERKETRRRYRNHCKTNIFDTHLTRLLLGANFMFRYLKSINEMGVRRIETVTRSGSLLRRACGAGDERWGVPLPGIYIFIHVAAVCVLR